MEKNKSNISEREQFNNLDINFINHNIMFIGKTPAFSLLFLILFIFPIMNIDIIIFTITTALFIFLYKSSKKIHLEGYHSPGVFLDVIKYIYKPRFYLLKDKNVKLKK